jgi:beta-phosphoglucomutase-like phosphatase (HAD superfamily)
MKVDTTQQGKEIQCMNEKLKAKGIFLDLDGTIVDSTEAYIEAARIAFQAVGQKRSWRFREGSNNASQSTTSWKMTQKSSSQYT